MAIGNSITFMVDLAGDRHYIELNPSVLSDNVSSRSNKVVTDTVVDNAFTSFKSNNTIDSITGYASSSKWPTARSTYQMISRMSQGVAGGFLGNLTVAQINALTTHKNGDNAVVTDSGTVNPGSVAVVAGDKISWTTGNVWVKELTNYIRPEDYATTVRGGTVVSTANTAGSISIDENGHATVNGWDTFAKASLINCDESGLFNLMSTSGNGGWIASSDEEFKVVTYKSNSGQHETLNFSLSAIWNWIKGKLSSEANVNISGNAATATSATKSYACHDNGSANAKTIKMWYKTDATATGSGDIQKVYPNTPTRALITNTNWLAAYCTNDDGTDIRSVNASDVTVGNAIDSTKINGHSIEVVSSGSSVSTTAGTISIVTFN